jgi:SNF2 family DNA or RNA helicase
MLNFRKLKQDFSSFVLKEGNALFKDKMVLSAKIIHLGSDSLKINAQVRGSFGNTNECEIEVDRQESEIVDSNCDCPYSYDCQHLAGLLFYLEKHLDKIIESFSKGKVFSEASVAEEEQFMIKESIRKIVKENKSEENLEPHEAEALEEYKEASGILSSCSLFLPHQETKEDQAELLIIFNKPEDKRLINLKLLELQLALRLPFRSKPLHIPHVKNFLDALKHHEPLNIAGKRFFFTRRSFDELSQEVLQMVLSYARFEQQKNNQRSFCLEAEAFGAILAKAYSLVSEKGLQGPEKALPCIFLSNIETPLNFSTFRASLKFNIEMMRAHTPKLFLVPQLLLQEKLVNYENGFLFENDKPGLLYEGIYYRFEEKIKRAHLKYLPQIRDMTIPESLFGTLVENSLPELLKFAKVGSQHILEDFITLPYVEKIKAKCSIFYLEGELEASLSFLYGDVELPSAFSSLNYSHIRSFITEDGVVARDLFKEQKIVGDLFEGFIFNPENGTYVAKTEKRVVEFMTSKLPQYKDDIDFDCPENLTSRFLYDQSSFKISLKDSNKVNCFEVHFEVEGGLKGISVDLLWECVASKKTYIELNKSTKSKGNKETKKILVIDLSKIKDLVQVFDEFGVRKIENHMVERPLWSLVSVQQSSFKGLPLSFKMSDRLKDLQKQMLGKAPIEVSEIPKEVDVDLRQYQADGIAWLEKLRKMSLGGILADDMGLGKTIQAICALTQDYNKNPKATSLVVCPTSLLYNWQEECSKFHKGLKTLVVDGLPNQRKKLLKKIKDYQLIVTSYSLLQKDIDEYSKVTFSYVILDEAQHIKNRMTLNAKSVKRLNATNRLILTGTPIENCLEEIWSLFDFLMPGLLNTYDRFMEKYIRNLSKTGKTGGQKELQKKTAPFILRRLKSDVLDDLPPISELIYHCHLSPYQKELYTSYATSAKKELSKLVEKEGFDNIRIHVLATLTRLKQICCHPAVFSKDKLGRESCAKYDMLLELLQTLIEGGHKSVVFSQYTRMLGIIREDLENMGIKFSYLDGSSKNRLEIVKNFNKDPSIKVFLVSLKAGGTGLNLVGADTVIHYDMWWNPAVENQATDRVYRIGQDKAVSKYKLVTLGTIEEKILSMQNRKKKLVKDMIHSDEEALSKLSWEDVLELLQT